MTESCLSRFNPIDNAEMIFIPAGEFLMGFSDENNYNMSGENNDCKSAWFAESEPMRLVNLDGYWIYKNEVTVGQYKLFCEDTRKIMPRKPTWGWKEDHPIVRVSWADATAYARWAGMRLPTEAEWERAARGTDGRRYPWGNDWDYDKLRCSIKRGGDAGSTAPVESYLLGASPSGVLDMEGNVGEWCSDWYDPNYYKSAPSTNPNGPLRGTSKVRRGGGWYDDNLAYFHVARRFSLQHSAGYHDIGFRCATSSL